MLERFRKFVKGRDEFGHAAKVNYDGDESFSTWLGALLSIAYMVFILIIALFEAVEVISYKNPQVS